jgi:DNA-binding CsgD family transcriptional regulator
MSQASTDGRLRRVAEVVEVGARSLPVHGRLPAPVLQALAALVPSDCVTFADLDPELRTHFADDEVVDRGVTFLPEPETDPENPFWAHYDQTACCSYPTRSGDDRSVTMRSDFCSTREWKQTPMYLDVMRDGGLVHELMCPLPTAGGRSRRVLFFRSGSQDFTEDDRFALALLRPHLAELVARRDTARSAPLTERQLELMGLVADGRTNAQIATALHLSPHTVRTHLTNIFERLGVTTRAAAVAQLFSV